MLQDGFSMYITPALASYLFNHLLLSGERKIVEPFMTEFPIIFSNVCKVCYTWPPAELRATEVTSK